MLPGEQFDFAVGSSVASDKITVTKEAVRSGTTVDYRIVIGNISDEEVTIETFRDELSFSPGCLPGGGSPGIIKFGQPGFVGNTLLPSVPDSTTIPVGGNYEVNFELNGIIPDGEDGTYINSIVVTAVGETGQSAIATVSTEIGNGGCGLCPGGWPLTPLPIQVNQGPDNPFTHAGKEAVDLGPPGSGGRHVLATHSGTVRVRSEDSECAANCYLESGCANTIRAYGCFIDIESTDDQFVTRYAHLIASDQYNLDGRFVTKGTAIGTMGSSGNSTGPHLHYEFPDSSHQCLPGHPMQLRQISGDQYVPVTIKRGCGENISGINDCNQVFN